ncbi:MAG TPA: L,D-transpeptidase [Xanthobacteraceae bacterium]|nr:L,D-transpeptidase [Xanthobacteraceae bacterium]
MPEPHPPRRPDRRAALRLIGSTGALAAVAAMLPARAADDPDLVNVAAMKPGQYVWYPERAPEGFVAILVSLPDQRAYVYRNGVRIGVATCSTGKAGHETPVGVFTILQKDKDHHSSVYDNAPMPFTERLTWSGVALHAGGLPGYPSSHGCVHLPLAFAKLLFTVTHDGTPVIIADAHALPVDVLHPGLVLPADVDAAARAAVAKANAAAGAAAAPAPAQPAVSVVISRADASLIVLQNGDVAFQAPVTIRDAATPLGNVVFVLKSLAGSATWTALSYEGGGAPGAKPTDAIDRISVSGAVNTRLSALLAPGSVMLLTDLPAHSGTRSQPDFVVMAQETP